MDQFHEDIYTEPSRVNVDTLRNQCRLRGMAGIREGKRGHSEPFHHTDRNCLKKIAELAPNPMARK